MLQAEFTVLAMFYIIHYIASDINSGTVLVYSPDISHGNVGILQTLCIKESALRQHGLYAVVLMHARDSRVDSHDAKDGFFTSGKSENCCGTIGCFPLWTHARAWSSKLSVWRRSQALQQRRPVDRLLAKGWASRRRLHLRWCVPSSGGKSS